MQHFLVRVDHGSFGWVVFAITMLAYVFIVRRWRHSDLPEVTVPVTTGSGWSWRGSGMAAALALLASAAIPLWTWVAPVGAAAHPNVTVPAGIAGWSGPVEPCAMQWQPQFASADWQRQHEYRRDQRTVCLYLASYLSQHQGKELIGYLQSVHEPGSDIVAARVRQVSGVAVNELQLGSRTGFDRLVWYAYAVGDNTMRRGIEAQLTYALGTLRGPRAASVFAISAECAPDCATARESLAEFLPHVIDTFIAGGHQ
jgi:EpsI family protein